MSHTRDELGVLEERSSSDAFAASVAFFDRSVDAVVFTAPDGRILDANEAACRMLGMSRDEICRRGRGGLADPADERWVIGVEERSRTGRFVGPLSFRRGDGTMIELNVSSAVFRNSDGDLRSVVVMRPPVQDASPEDAAVIDPSGIPNLPAFIHLAEEQLRKAARDHLALGLAYLRVVPDTDASGRDHDVSRQRIAARISAECRIGDMIGRVGANDFAILLTGQDTEELLAVTQLGVSRIREDDLAPSIGVHVGFMTIDSHGDKRVIEILDQARRTMDEHEKRQGASSCATSRRCLFALDGSSVRSPVDLDAGNGGVSLTARELEVIRLLAARRSYREIAQTLYIALNTVKTHVSSAYMKLGVNGREPAIERARSLGLLAAPTRPTTADRATRSPERETNGPLVDFGRLTLVARALTAAVDADDILDIIVMQGFRGRHADAAIVTLVVNGALVPVATYGYPQESVAAFFPASLAENLPVTVAAREQALVWVPNRADAQQRFPALAASRLARSNAWIAAPLVAEGRAFGAFGVSFFEPHDFDESERAYISMLSDICSLALHRQRDEHLIPDAVLGNASVVMRLRRGAEWPRGAWLLRDVSRDARARLVAEGYAIVEEHGGRVIVEPHE